jgi:hypothetical protein
MKHTKNLIENMPYVYSTGFENSKIVGIGANSVPPLKRLDTSLLPTSTKQKKATHLRGFSN